MKRPIADSIVFITGASAGIGAATAQRLAAVGATIILCARRIEVLESMRQLLTDPERHFCIAVDVADARAVALAVDSTIQRYGRLDAVICNAGIGLTAPVSELDYVQFMQVMAVNVGGFLHFVQAITPVFLRQQAGQFVVISSVVGQHALPYNGGYAATKGALERLCESLRIELLGTPLSVSVIRPGTVASEFFAHRLGPDGERRSTHKKGMDPVVVAETVIRALAKEQRILYPRMRDQLLSIIADVFPSLSDQILARTFRWQQKTGGDDMSPPAGRN